MRDSVVFYRSFYEAVKELPPEEFKKSVSAIMEYGLDGIMPQTSGIEKSMYIMAKPQIDANNRRYENSKRGGRKPNSNQSETKQKPNSNQSETKQKPNSNQSETKQKPNSNQSETKPLPKEKVKEKVKVNVNDKEISAPVDSAESPCAGKFLLNDGSEYKVTENDVVTYQQLYPGIDVKQELRSIEAWCLSNPKNRKTRSGAKRFMNAWLSRSQNSAKVDKPERKSVGKNAFTNYPQRTYDYAELEKQLLSEGR